MVNLQETINAILEKQTEEGLFPTYRVKKEDKHITESQDNRVDNIGIHTFVLEKLTWLQPNNERVKTAFQRGLNYLIKNAVVQDGRYVWRWLKNPKKTDWLYPADADDTARARTVIEIAKANGFHIPEEFQDFDYSKFIREGLTPLGGRLTFVGFKPDDSLCPVVNMNLLHSLRGSLEIGEKWVNQSKECKIIKRYIEKTVNTDEFASTDFARCSKFYLSHNLLGYLISEIREIFDKDTLLKVKDRIERANGEYGNPLEASLGTSALINLHGRERIIKYGIEQIRNSVLPNKLWIPAPFYQHQRSGNVFGSSAGTSVFCLEALSKYEESGR